MHLLYTHPNIVLVENAKNLVEGQGVPVILQNQYASGGIGELAPINAWPELWIEQSHHFRRAQQILEEIFAEEAQPDWQCIQCQEMNSGAFDYCWQCQKEKPFEV
ncbi:MAG: DUF2007 domain-containing protein [Cellvibrionaceae bacterium]